jgi:hypothetical protein
MPSPISQITTSANAVALTTGTTVNIGSAITLTAGHLWLVWGQVDFTDTDDFTATDCKRAGISASSSAFPGLDSGQGFRDNMPTTAGLTQSVPVMPFFVTPSTDTDYHLVADADFSNGGKSAFGFISAVPLT